MGTINQRNAAQLLFSLRSPVFETLDDLGQELVHAARANAGEIMRNFSGNTDALLEAIDYEIIQTGFLLELRVGIHDEGPITRYLADKEDREHSWLQPALDEVRG